jgi:hypothetical protein
LIWNNNILEKATRENTTNTKKDIHLIKIGSYLYFIYFYSSLFDNFIYLCFPLRCYVTFFFPILFAFDDAARSFFLSFTFFNFHCSTLFYNQIHCFLNQYGTYLFSNQLISIYSVENCFIDHTHQAISTSILQTFIVHSFFC